MRGVLLLTQRNCQLLKELYEQITADAQAAVAPKAHRTSWRKGATRARRNFESRSRFFPKEIIMSVSDRALAFDNRKKHEAAFAENCRDFFQTLLLFVWLLASSC